MFNKKEGGRNMKRSMAIFTAILVILFTMPVLICAQSAEPGQKQTELIPVEMILAYIQAGQDSANKLIADLKTACDTTDNELVRKKINSEIIPTMLKYADADKEMKSDFEELQKKGTAFITADQVDAIVKKHKVNAPDEQIKKDLAKLNGIINALERREIFSETVERAGSIIEKLEKAAGEKPELADKIRQEWLPAAKLYRDNLAKAPKAILEKAVLSENAVTPEEIEQTISECLPESVIKNVKQSVKEMREAGLL